MTLLPLLGDARLTISEASDFVIAAEKPSAADGGPCETCAFRLGTEANTTDHTITLARLCVEAGEPFRCHEWPRLCRGWIAAVNLKGAPQNEDERRWQKASRFALDILNDAIAEGVKADLLQRPRGHQSTRKDLA